MAIPPPGQVWVYESGRPGLVYYDPVPVEQPVTEPVEPCVNVPLPQKGWIQPPPVATGGLPVDVPWSEAIAGINRAVKTERLLGDRALRKQLQQVLGLIDEAADMADPATQGVLAWLRENVQNLSKKKAW
jgi:hypothetical protein